MFNLKLNIFYNNDQIDKNNMILNLVKDFLMSFINRPYSEASFRLFKSLFIDKDIFVPFVFEKNEKIVNFLSDLKKFIISIKKSELEKRLYGDFIDEIIFKIKNDKNFNSNNDRLYERINCDNFYLIIKVGLVYFDNKSLKRKKKDDFDKKKILIKGIFYKIKENLSKRENFINKMLKKNLEENRKKNLSLEIRSLNSFFRKDIYDEFLEDFIYNK